MVNQFGWGTICDMAYIVPMHVKPKFTYLLTCFTSSLELLLLVCKREAPEAQILSHFGWASKWVKIQVFQYFVENFGLDSQ